MSAPIQSLNKGTLSSEFPRITGAKVDVAIESILLFFVYLSLGLRLWSRKLQRVQLQLNDYLIILATLLMTARTSIMLYAMVNCGVGLHLQEVVYIGGMDLLELFLKLLYVVDLLWVSLVSLIKLSILHFYLMVFRQRVFRTVVYVVMGIITCFWCGAFFGTAFFCSPPKKQWDLAMQTGHCGNRKLLTSVPSGTDLALDVIVIVLPMPILWGLQMPTAKKVALTFVFSLGFLIIGITAYRIKPMLALDTNDITHSAMNMAVLASTVPLLGIINANLPVMPPAFKAVFKSSALGSTLKKSFRTDDSSRSRHEFSQLAEPEIPLVDTRVAAQNRALNTSRHTKIMVTKDWDVQSLGSSPHHGMRTPSDNNV